MNKHLEQAITFLGIELGAFSAFIGAKNEGLEILYWTSFIALIAFGIFSIYELVLMYKQMTK